MRAQAGNQAGDAHFFVMACFGQLAGEVADRLVQVGHHRAERVVRNIQADQLALPVEHLALAEFGRHCGQGDLFDHAGMRAKHAHLAQVSGAEIRAADG